MITAEQLNLYRRAKATFEQSRNSLDYRTLRKQLCKEGFTHQQDFLNATVKQLCQFDRVLMNSPYLNNRWKLHLYHAR
ncbi:hypothetical protein [Moellerella wisconsensis]|uniref:Uncharacterized protein n=2 Tax=Moellerella wisconsensis TaxID=158849 RepID=A0A9Q8Q476_9GAMM|nr:hypothetical protein [Moellerella wisconsensis]UNH24769.1 hypothetical protein MNY68_03175 [Moellerella wisconsensis]UNH27872.1 hypothetical protein MNY64_03265 [Moellerella wisconsensis]UNH31378.1 hypothetical protein MNY72_03395 [Moellerella wisconsensis]UNH39497.1 hypothetical protein MNY70_03205 [Moellerella wisconsensis]UNH43003.1 hypothetical protein MNY66_03090 [Moellerella wisconsensis]